MQVCSKKGSRQYASKKFGLFSGYLDCQNSHYEVDLLGKSTFKPIPYTSRINNKTQQKSAKQKLHRKNLFLLIEKENLTDRINLPGLHDLISKYIINFF